MKLFQSELMRQLDTEAHLWLIDPAASSKCRLKKYREVLSQEELTRWSQFRLSGDCQTFLVSHATLRYLLSTYVDRPPASWDFEHNAYGKPEIESSLNKYNLRFNISHTEGLIACLICKHVDCGVDVDWLDRKVDTVRIAERMFAPAEQHDIQKYQWDQQRRRFFEYWTLKEAFVKSLGLGLSYPMTAFSMQIKGPDDISVDLDSDSKSDDSWQFYLTTTASRHAVAAAIKHKLSSSRLHIVSKMFTNF